MDTRTNTIHAILNLSWNGKSLREIKGTMNLFKPLKFVLNFFCSINIDEYKYQTGKNITPNDLHLKTELATMSNVHQLTNGKYISTSPNSILYRNAQI